MEIAFDLPPFIAVFEGFFRLIINFSEGMLGVSNCFGNSLERFSHNSIPFLQHVWSVKNANFSHSILSQLKQFSCFKGYDPRSRELFKKFLKRPKTSRIPFNGRAGRFRNTNPLASTCRSILTQPLYIRAELRGIQLLKSRPGSMLRPSLSGPECGRVLRSKAWKSDSRK